jgi:hypothetical protein
VLALTACPGARGDMSVSTVTPVVRVLQCMQANAPPMLSIGELRIAAEGRDVTTRNLTARLWVSQDQGVRAQLKVSMPRELAGSRYLLLDRDPEDELYLYLPAVGKPRRVTGVGTDSEIAGTSVNLSDLRTVAQAIKSASVSLSGATTLQGRNADILRFVPSVADSPWRRVLVTVDRTTCATVRVEFQDAGGTARTYDADLAQLRQAGRWWYAQRGVIKDLRRGTTAALELLDVSTGEAPRGALFDPKRFYQAD